MMKRNSILWIFVLSIICCIGFYISEQVFKITMLYNTLFKAFIFLASTILYFVFTKDMRFFGQMFQLSNKKKNMKIWFILVPSAFASILIGFFLFQDFFEIERLAAELTNGLGIDAESFWIVALYITFGNSFLEEVFFRGFMFINILKKGYRKTAYLFSALLFSFYHISIIQTWFPPIITLLLMIGLFLSGMLFNYLDEQSGNIYNAWIIHILAVAAISIIGFYIFSIA